MSEYHAEEVNYWQTSQSAPDKWIERAKTQISSVGGCILREAYGQEETTGQAAFMLEFALDGERYKVIWPVLASDTGKKMAAKRQAATALFHDVKNRCVALKFLGGRAAFFSYLMLGDGRTASQVSIPEIEEGIPRMMLVGSGNENG